MPDALPPKVRMLFADQQWEAQLQSDFVSVRVTDHLDAADLCVMRFDNPELRYRDYESFKPGTSVEVDLGWGDEAQPVFYGEVVGTELLYPREGPPKIEVRAFDRLFRLMRKKQERTFLEMSDSDVAEQVAQEHGLRYEGDSTSVTYPYLMQTSESDWHFLVHRARCSGRVVRIEDTMLTFKDATTRPDPVRTLTYEDDLPELTMTVGIADLPTEVTVRAWDPATKAKIEGVSKSADLSPELETTELGAEVAREALGDAPVLMSDFPVTSAQEAEALAESLLREASRLFSTCEFTMTGDPQFRAGAVLELAGLGNRLSGRYAIRTSHHDLSTRGYTTRCELWRNGWVPPPPEEAAAAETSEEKVDIEAVIVDAMGNPMPNMEYTLYLADGTSREGQTDSEGNLLEAGCPKGPYQIENEEYRLSILERH